MPKLLILSADQWSMTDDEGKPMKGTSVFAVSEFRDSSSNGIGNKPVKLNLDHNKFNELQAMGLPCLVQADYDMRPIAGGKAGLTIVSLKKLKSVELFGA